ncbi:MAG: phage portal protein [Paenisporosarcina sp.]
MPILDRVRSAWNAFRNNSQLDEFAYGTTTYYGGGSPSRPRHNIYSERSIVSSIYTRISVDVSGLIIKHVKMDAQGRYLKDMESALNDCFVLEANIDQSPRAFRQDIAMTLFDKGVAAVVPVDTSRNPKTNEIFDIYTMRVGEIVSWYPRHVKISLYNENLGKREEITLEKRYIAIIENPLFAVMNEPNSTLQRLIRKLGLLDAVDEQSSSGKLDIIIQLPYVIKSEARRQQAEKRREDIEFQLKGSQYGIAYTDGTEKITQLNRPAENNLLKQVEYLTNMLYSQLGLTEEVMNGTANEEAMLNYFNRTVEPIIDAIIESMQRAFLGPQGTRNSERIRYFRDPFKLVPVNEIAEIADKFTRNEILTANEIRGFMGISPSTDPKADQLVNSNMPQPEPEIKIKGPSSFERISQNGS